jgi:beta-lactamase class A
MSRNFPLLLFLALAPVSVGAQRSPSVTVARADTARLHKTLDSLANAHHGIVGYAVHNVDTGEHLSLRGDETFPTASLIKVGVLVTLFDLVEKKQISLDDPIRVLKIDKVGGSGLLQYLHDGLEITVGDAAWLMSTVSDNTATNLLLDKVKLRTVWQRMEALGLQHTKIHAESFRRDATSIAMDSSVKYGLGVTTPNEMARLFQMLASGKAVNARADSVMLDILEHNTMNQMLQRYVAGVAMAHKDGEGDDIRTECALFRLQSRVVACVLTNKNQDKRWLVDNEAQLTMANMGAAIAGAWPRLTAANRQ